MGTEVRRNTNFVIGPDGQHLTLADLPRPDTKRWVIRRKAEVVMAVDGGLLSLGEACERYRLTPEEFMVWENSLRAYGPAGLRITHAQQYRHGEYRNR
ncbi:MAG TPA: DUF1153 domain-containing protein [Rhizomicrobium sp.]|nr:DUF1153 domain-containing protein [Rhizomicrobium sp.]